MQPPPVRRHVMQGLLVLLAWLCLAAAPTAHAQGVELATLQAARADGALNLEFSARVNLPKAVEDAL